LRSLDPPRYHNLSCILPNIHGFDKIQHLAIPFYNMSLPSNASEDEWIQFFFNMPKLKTLTLMVGGKEKSWRGDCWVQLRDMEEWFADGRKDTANIFGTAVSVHSLEAKESVGIGWGSISG
jgi:hypothetical protein